jgi:hypothetical protein
MTTAQRIRTTLLGLLQKRGAGKTICPSEVARQLGGETWRNLMPDVRAVGTRLMDEGKIVTLQKGKVVDVRTAKGPIRFGLPPG